MDAALYGPARLVELLIKKGADVRARDRWGKTAVARAKSPRIVDLLTRAGAIK